MKKTSCILLLLVIMMTFAATLNSTSAYFTTYATAEGGYVLELKDGIIPEEGFSNWTKRVVIMNSTGSVPVFVRVKAFCSNQYQLEYGEDKKPNEKSHWELRSDGYWYYDEILYGGDSTNTFLVRINNIPEDAVPGDSFNVIVIYETTPVLYDENNNAWADWSLKAGAE